MIAEHAPRLHDSPRRQHAQVFFGEISGSDTGYQSAGFHFDLQSLLLTKPAHGGLAFS